MVTPFSFSLDKQTAIITGAGSGIGEATAILLAKSGVNVVVNDLNPDRIERVVEQITELGGQAIGIDGDISNRFQASSLIERSRDTYGKIDILMNCVGIYKANDMLKVDEWDWRRQIEVNITGTFFMVQLLGRVMADEGGGAIVNLASTAGHPNPFEQGIGYVTGKAGVIAMTKQSAKELASHNIRVNAVCPRYINEPDMPQEDTPSNAMQRMGSMDDVANLMVFLASPLAQFITGQAINIDGGESML